MDYSRRSFVLMGLGLLAAGATGCAGSATSTGPTSHGPLPRPHPPWDDGAWEDVLVAKGGPRSTSATYTRGGSDLGRWGSSAGTASSISSGLDGVISRSRWSNGSPIVARMNRLTPVYRVTVHHDGNPKPVLYTTERDVAAYIDFLRRLHVERGWGDIGYHFVVDRAGRVWEGRSISYQGAHVKDQNEGNIGVVCLGNFDLQSPSQPQLAALTSHVRRLMGNYNVGQGYLRTHQELAPTACPGRSLQSWMVNSRRGGVFA